MQYFQTKELVVLNSLTWSWSTWVIWYLQKDWTFSSEISSPNTKAFNFQNNMYAIFLKSTSWSTLLYKIRSQVKTNWQDVYIVPIDDSDSKVVRYLWNEILIWEDWEYIAKETEIFYKK